MVSDRAPLRAAFLLVLPARVKGSRGEELEKKTAWLVGGLYRGDSGLIATQNGRIIPEWGNERRILFGNSEIIRIIFTNTLCDVGCA